MIYTSLIGCTEDNDVTSSNCIKGESTITTQILPVANFNGIDLTISNNVTVKQGSTQEVKAIGHPNIIDKITTSVSNNLWEIRLENDCYEDYELSIEITVPNINRLELSGSGDILVNDFINQNDLNLKISGSGNIDLNEFEGITNIDIILSGSERFKVNNDISTLNTLGLTNSGSGKYVGFAISSNDCTINSSGSGNNELKAINSLNVTISGSGSVFYKGTPSITQNVTGSGNLIDAN
jgi:hypothetical protein